jgi:nucleoside-diphosphate-sugar epimerase
MTRNPIILGDLQSIYSKPIDWKRFAGKTVLVSGANGFLPAYMVEMLLYLNTVDASMNVQVIALVRNEAKAKLRFSEYADDQHLHLLVQDVCHEINVPQHIDFIIHAASQASPKYYKTDPVGTLSANILGTINLVKLAEQHKVESFLYFSSGEVYGEVPEANMPVKEDQYGYVDPTQLRSCYAESKRMGENICVSWYHQYGVQSRIVRPFHTYGPKMLLDDGRVYADFVANILHGENIAMKSDGSARRAFCYLSDATAGFFTVLLKGECGTAYNIGNPGGEHSILELAKIVAALYPEKNTRVLEVAPAADSSYLKSVITRNSPNIDRITQLGWTPQVKTAEGFKRTIESYIATTNYKVV